MTEWSKVLVLKTIVLHDGTVGSNPTLSFCHFFFAFVIQLTPNKSSNFSERINYSQKGVVIYSYDIMSTSILIFSGVSYCF